MVSLRTSIILQYSDSAAQKYPYCQAMEKGSIIIGALTAVAVVGAGIAYSFGNSGTVPAQIGESRPGAQKDGTTSSAAPENEGVSLEDAVAFCLRGSDPLLMAEPDAQFADLAGNPDLEQELMPACDAVTKTDGDPAAKAAAHVVMARALNANGHDGSWHLRRAAELAPDTVPVMLLNLQLNIAAKEASQEVFNDVSDVRKELTQIGPHLPASAVKEISARITAAELRGEWHNRDLVKFAMFGGETPLKIEPQTRISFMNGIETGCAPFGFKPTIDQSLGATLGRLKSFGEGNFLLEQEPFSDGRALGSALNCRGAQLDIAYRRIAAPLANDGQSLMSAIGEAWRKP